MEATTVLIHSEKRNTQNEIHKDKICMLQPLTVHALTSLSHSHTKPVGYSMLKHQSMYVNTGLASGRHFFLNPTIHKWSWVSSVSIMTGLWTQQSRFQFLERGSFSLPLHSDQLQDLPSLQSSKSGALFPGAKQLGCDTDNSPP